MTQELSASPPAGSSPTGGSADRGPTGGSADRDKLMTTELVPEQILPKVMTTFGLTAAYVFIICWITLKGTVATSAPIRAHCTRCSGCRIEAARIFVS